MHGTYDRTYSQMHSSSQGFQKAQNKILRLLKHNVRINRLNGRFLLRNNDFLKKESMVIRRTLCSKCPEDHELCEEGIDPKRRYYCKVLSERTGEHVRLYLPSYDDSDYRKDRLKRRIINTVAWNQGASQTLISKIVRGDKRLIRDCLNELTLHDYLRCNELKEKGNKVKRYYIIYH